MATSSLAVISHDSGRTELISFPQMFELVYFFRRIENDL